MEEFVFELEAVGPTTIEVRWPKALGTSRSEPYQHMARLLEAVNGVDRVEVLRYTAHVEVADHVLSIEGVLKELEEWLLDDGMLQHYLVAAGVTDYGVTQFR